MRSVERRKEILGWLAEAGNLTLAEMVDRFGVSKMTIHRDLERLEQRRALKRIHGGAVRIEVPALATERREVPGFDQLAQLRCLICNRQPSEQLLYSLSLKSGEQKRACCPHCGISAHLLLGDKVAMAMTADFLSGRLHSAQHSFFVLGSVVAHCCKPSVLTFDDEEMALRFVRGFGGRLGRFDDALAFLAEDTGMHAASGCPHCAPVGRQIPKDLHPFPPVKKG